MNIYIYILYLKCMCWCNQKQQKLMPQNDKEGAKHYYILL